MANLRRQSYYSKGQIKKGQLTNGGEYTLLDGTEYKGQYHTYSTGEVFTESSYVEDVSKPLIPFIDTTNDSLFGINSVKNFEYNTIKKVNIKKSQRPNPTTVTPTDKDLIRGYVIRNFAVKVNDDEVFEIASKDIQKIGTDGGLDANLYKTFSLRWKISGPINDILDSNGNIKESGIEQGITQNSQATSHGAPSSNTQTSSGNVANSGTTISSGY